MTDLILKDEVYAVVGAAMEVYWQLGTGFLEPVYQEAFEIELRRRGIPFEAQKRLIINYKGQPLRRAYVADVVCYGQIIVELKAHDRLIPQDVAQLLNYMKATGMHVGLLFNFGSSPRLEWKRLVLQAFLRADFLFMLFRVISLTVFSERIKKLSTKSYETTRTEQTRNSQSLRATSSCQSVCFRG